MDFWNKVKADIQKGIKEGVGLLKEGVSAVKEKAGELTEEGKKQLKLFELKTKVQKEISELGGRVYDIKATAKNPMLDGKVKAIISRIKKLETQIVNFEKPKKEATKKAASKKTAPKRRVRAKSKQ